MTGAAISQAAASGAPTTADAPDAGGAESSGAPDPIGLKGLLAPILPSIGLAFACGAVGYIQSRNTPWGTSDSF